MNYSLVYQSKVPYVNSWIKQKLYNAIYEMYDDFDNMRLTNNERNKVIRVINIWHQTYYVGPPIPELVPKEKEQTSKDFYADLWGLNE